MDQTQHETKKQQAETKKSENLSKARDRQLYWALGLFFVLSGAFVAGFTYLDYLHGDGWFKPIASAAKSEGGSKGK